MPRRLTVIGVLTALVIGAVGLFHGTASADPPEIQFFPANGIHGVNAGTCWYDGTGTFERPVLSGGHIVCGANTTEFNVAAGTGTAVPSATFIELQTGNRLTLPITFTPSGAGQFSSDPAEIPCTLTTPGPGDGYCSQLEVTGSVTAQTDLLCSSGALDVLASAIVGTPAGWPDDGSDGNGYLGFDFKRTEDATVTGLPSNDGNPAVDFFTQNAYVNQIQPFPASFTFRSLDTSILTKLFLGGGGAGFTIPNTPLQLYTASSSYAPGQLNVSVALLAGAPNNPPDNSYLCTDSGQSSETNITYVVPPTTDGLYPRWVQFLSAADLVSGRVDRVLDMQCVGVGAVTAVAGAADGDGDDDCLTVAGGDTNDANPDQDTDGLPDGVEAFAGSSLTVADADADGANDYVELFQFTDDAVADTDLDGSLDMLDNGSDENTGAAGVFADDTLADDNCPSDANIDQLNTDSSMSYHGGADRRAYNATPFLSGWVNTGPGPGPGDTRLNYGPLTTMTLSIVGATVRVNLGTSGPHGYAPPSGTNVNLGFVEVSGVTGSSTGGVTAAQNNAIRTAANGVLQVDAATTAALLVLRPVANSTTAGLAAGVYTLTGTVISRPPTGDLNNGPTNPNQDINGDACDTDDDNDGIGDVAEPQVLIVPWGGPGTTVCEGPGTAGGVAPTIPLNPLTGDSDGDMVLDGAECQQSGRPDETRTSIASCATGPADPDGCARPRAATAGEDADTDGIYGSGIAGGHLLTEQFFRTQTIAQYGPAVSDTDLDGAAGIADKDSDADWNYGNLNGTPNCLGGQAACLANAVGLQDGLEARYYATQPSNGDTDHDGCDDGREVADFNGNRVVGPDDGAILAAKSGAILGIPNLDSGTKGDPVLSDGRYNPLGVNTDINKDGVHNPGDSAIREFFEKFKPGACQNPRQQGKTILGDYRSPFATY